MIDVASIGLLVVAAIGAIARVASPKAKVIAVADLYLELLRWSPFVGQESG